MELDKIKEAREEFVKSISVRLDEGDSKKLDDLIKTVAQATRDRDIEVVEKLVRSYDIKDINERCKIRALREAIMAMNAKAVVNVGRDKDVLIINNHG